MTEAQIKDSLERNELQLSFWGAVNHYGIVWFLCIYPVVFLLFQLIDTINRTSRTLREAELWFIVLPPFLALFFYFIQRDKLKFKSVDTSLSKPELDKIIRKVGKELGWIITTNNKNVVIAKTIPTFLSGSWGEQITIIIDQNRILVNSICDLNQPSSIASFGRNKKNMKTLIRAIESSSY
jgi:hypothetical protein